MLVLSRHTRSAQPARPLRLNRNSLQARNLLFAAPMGQDYGGLYHELVTGNHIVRPTNAPAVQADVEHGLVPIFDGTNDYLETNGVIDLSALGASPMTVSYWQYWPGYTNNNGISLELSEDADNEPGSFVLVPNFGDGFFLIVYQGAGSSQYVNAWISRPSVGWHHYSIGLDPSSNATFTAYVDGVAVTVNAHGTPGTLNQPWGNHRLYFMSRAGVSNWGQPGAGLRDVRFYAGHLPPAAAWQLWDPRTRWELYQPPRLAMVPVASSSYDLGMTLVAGAGFSDAATLTMSASVPLQAQGSVVDGQNAALPVVSALAARAVLAQASSIVMALQEALGVVAGAVAVGGPAYTQSLALSLSAVLTASRSLLLSPAVSLPASVHLALSPQLTLQAATVLAGSAVFAPNGSLVAPMVSSLSAAAALAAQETVVVATSLTIAAQAQLATQAQQLHANLLTLGVEAATAAQATAIYQQAFTLAVAAALQTQDVIFEPAVIQALFIAGERLKQSVIGEETLATASITNERLN